MNAALLAKLCWEILKRDNRFWINVLCAEYLNDSGKPLPTLSSHTWQSIKSGMPFVLDGLQ